MKIDELRMKEIIVFTELVKAGSVRALGRQKNISAGQISKLVAALEGKLGFKLIERSPLGVKLTAKAKETLPFLNEIYRQQDEFKSNFSTSELPSLGFATTSFFSTHLVPQLFSELTKTYPEYRLLLLDLAPDMFLPVAMRAGFAICIHMGKVDFPATWTSQKIGDLNWILVARRQHPLFQQPTLRNILKYPYVFPVYWSQEGLTYGTDNFPLAKEKRMRGIETSTATSAVEIIRLTDHLGFVPEIVVRPMMERGELTQVLHSSLTPVRQPVYLTVKSDRVSQKMYRWLVDIAMQKLIG